MLSFLCWHVQQLKLFTFESIQFDELASLFFVERNELHWLKSDTYFRQIKKTLSL